MKRLWMVSLAALLVVLSGCTVLVDIVPPIIYDATFRTDFQDAAGYYICDDVDTLMTYEFRFRDTLVGWRSYLRVTPIVGDTYIAFDRELTLDSPGVMVSGDRATYQFVIDSRLVPLAEQGELEPQAILVEVGSARLVLESRALDGTVRVLRLGPISIRTGCGN